MEQKNSRTTAPAAPVAGSRRARAIKAKKVTFQPQAWAGQRGRISDLSKQKGFGFQSTLSAEDRWRFGELDSNTFDKISVVELADLLVDLSPELSREASNVLRIANSGYELKAYHYDGRREHRQGKQVLDAFIEQLTNRYGSADTIFNQLFFSVFLRGAYLLELVLDKTGRRPVDLCAADPKIVSFKEMEDAERGYYWQMGQHNATGEFKPITAETVSYVAFDPFPGKPEGRSAIQASLFVAVALLRTLRDLSRVIAQQGYPRLDIEVNLQLLAETLPEGEELDVTTLQEWSNAIIKEVAIAYSKLEPDDAYIHTNVVKVNRPVGAIDTAGLGSIDSLMRVLERLAIRALRTMPLLMASDSSTSEGNSARQWEIYVRGISNLQHLVENGLSRAFSLALQAQGIAAKAVFRFAPVRATEEYRDAMTLQIKLDAYGKAYYLGLITLDEVAQAVFGKNAARELPIDLEKALAQAVQRPEETVSGEETQTQERTQGLSDDLARLRDQVNRLVVLYELDRDGQRTQPA